MAVSNLTSSSDKISSVADGEKKYYVGTLSYTKRSLVALFTWLLWGDFCFFLIPSVTGILPIKLKALGGSNVIMALIMTTLPGILNTTICPWVSFRSDRCRSRWGRRIPFILYTLPFLTLFMLLLGFSEQIGGFIHRLAFSHNGWFSATGVTIFMIAVFMVGFQFFNMFVGSVYYYLFNDVVPQQFMGRFLGLFRVVGGLSVVLYNYFVFKYVESYMTEIFVGTALLYFVSFGLMCLRVKEGEYPPPPEYIDGRQSRFAGLKTFFVECFSLKFYWYMFGASTFITLSYSANIFNIFFNRDVGLTLEQIGRLAAYGGVFYMVLAYPCGIIADKYHPLRVQVAMAIVTLFLTPLSLVFLFVKMSHQAAYYYMMITTLLILPATTLYTIAQMPTVMLLFPKERFGQFCSAQSMINAFGTILGGLIAGLVFDCLKTYYGGSDFAYRWVPAWGWLFQIFSLLCLIKVYREWKRYGGIQAYVPPMPAVSKKTDVADSTVSL